MQRIAYKLLKTGAMRIIASLTLFFASMAAIYFNVTQWKSGIVWLALWVAWMLVISIFLRKSRSMDKDDQYRNQEHDFFKGIK